MTDRVLERFPKQRPALPPAQRAIYETEYRANREGATLMSALSQWLEGWMHRAVARDSQGDTMLELGAGTLNHLRHVNRAALQRYDVVEPAAFLYADSPLKPSVGRFFADISEVTDSYDTICSVAVLEHITALPEAVARAGLRLKEGGVFVNAIPCEGGMLWGLSWRLSTGLSYRLRTGHSYANVMRHEHVNDYQEIVAVVRHFFRDVRIRFFPLHGMHPSLYACLTARDPDRERCDAYMEERKV